MPPEFAIGFLPFMIIGIAFIGAIMVLIPSKLSVEDITEIVIGMGTIWLTVIFVIIFMLVFCVNISPIERFTDTPSSSKSFLESLAKTEEAVCALMKETNDFIQGDVGQAGIDNPSLVTQAQAAALSSANAPTTVCPSSVAPTMETANDRLSRMEVTLSAFVEPEFVKTFKSTQTCEGFEDVESRLKKIQDTIRRLTGKYLDPIRQKKTELQSGILSDCDRKKGAATAVVKP
jgi:hypothetical protein